MKEKEGHLRSRKRKNNVNQLLPTTSIPNRLLGLCFVFQASSAGDELSEQCPPGRSVGEATNGDATRSCKHALIALVEDGTFRQEAALVRCGVPIFRGHGHGQDKPEFHYTNQDFGNNERRVTEETVCTKSAILIFLLIRHLTVCCLYDGGGGGVASVF